MFAEDALITGVVLENVTACEVDAACYLRLEFADTAVVALYGTGERPAPPCAMANEVANEAFSVQAREMVGVVISRCGDEGLYLRRLVRLPAAGSAPSELDRAGIEVEVRQALEDYAASMVNEDYEAVEAFWGDFDDFIHAGDGRVFGDREAWIAWMRNNRPDRWVSWEFSDVHVAVLGPRAAAHTANFEVVSVVEGEEERSTGSWTYVLRKTSDGWRVVHSNGMHNEFSYYDTLSPAGMNRRPLIYR